MKRLVKGALVALVAALVSACTMDTVFHRYSHTSVSGWEKNDTLKFYVPPLHQGGVFAQQLDVRITGAYPFTAATLIVKQRIVPGNKELTDTINCTFSKPDGTRLSRGISYYQYSYPIAKSDLREGDSLVVSIYHDMKRDMLPGISDVGLHISRVSYLHNVLYQ
ncbi:gliding motility lipoprotein GldH [Hoylesella loescheii]|uniref:gliding motility lipoprotein GldH n=1 Tax=Hoylesella loescheii TaxID=840 RepID=UPI0028F0183D|nr:gliding motility lipoprotein GldH [Hoylesella loescheii]